MGQMKKLITILALNLLGFAALHAQPVTVDVVLFLAVDVSDML